MTMVRRIAIANNNISRIKGVAWLFAGLLVMLPISSTANAQSVSFEEILAKPDDLRLNLRFAQQQIAKGQLQQAASALERLLLNKPNWDTVRLLYAVVLYRMDDLESAKRELNILEGRGLTQKQEAERVRYLKLAERASNPFRITGRISVGARKDTNPTLLSDELANAPIGLGVGFLSSPAIGGSDKAFMANGSIRVEGDIDNSPGSTWFVEGFGYLNDFQKFETLDSHAGKLKAGFNFSVGRARITPYAMASSSYLQDEAFVSRWGGGVDFSVKITPEIGLFANGIYVKETYKVSDSFPDNGLKNGDYKGLVAGLQWRPIQQQSFRLMGISNRKSASDRGYAYKETGFAANSLTLLGKGAYLNVSYKRTDVDYDAVASNVFFTTDPRQDTRTRTRVSLGAPIKTILGGLGPDNGLPDSIGDITAQIGVTWTNQKSNYDYVEYENRSADIMFTKRFSF